MNKTEIYVPINSRKEAKQAKAVLKALGEALSNLFYSPDDTEDGYNALVYENHNWIVGKDKGKKEITLKQLIELLSTGSIKSFEIEKSLNNLKESGIAIINSGRELEEGLNKFTDAVINHAVASPKIAVRVDNEKEFNALMKYYDSLGWKDYFDGIDEEDLKASFMGADYAVDFHDEYRNPPIDTQKKLGYKIIPFTDFAKEHNIKLPDFQTNDGEWIYKLDNFWWVQKVNGEYQRPIESCLRTHKPESDLITFSTKESALDWIEAQKPKRNYLSGGKVYFEVNENLISFKDEDGRHPVHFITKKDLNLINERIADER